MQSLKEEMTQDLVQVLEQKNEQIFTLKTELKKERDAISELQAKLSSL